MSFCQTFNFFPSLLQNSNMSNILDGFSDFLKNLCKKKNWGDLPNDVRTHFMASGGKENALSSRLLMSNVVYQYLSSFWTHQQEHTFLKIRQQVDSTFLDKLPNFVEYLPTYRLNWFPRSQFRKNLWTSIHLINFDYLLKPTEAPNEC